MTFRDRLGNILSGIAVYLPKHQEQGTWAQRRELSQRIRQLAAVAVETLADEKTLLDCSRHVQKALDALLQEPRQSLKESYLGPDHAVDEWADKSSMVGHAHPFAPPITIHKDSNAIVGRVTYGPLHEGAPGLVHGGYVAAAMDHMASMVGADLDLLVVTGKLDVRYKRPTRLHREIRYEATLDSHRHRLLRVQVRALDDEEITAEASALFYELKRDELFALIDGKEFRPSMIIRGEQNE